MNQVEENVMWLWGVQEDEVITKPSQSLGSLGRYFQGTKGGKKGFSNEILKRTLGLSRPSSEGILSKKNLY